MYKLYASTEGNPDRGQYAPISDPAWIKAKTLDKLREKVNEYQNWWMVGGGNWIDPIVYRNSKALGRMSYNGRIWVTDHKVIDGKFVQGIEFEYKEEVN